MENQINIPFFRPDISDLEIQAVEKVLRSGWITTGPECRSFEKELKDFCEADGAIVLSSQTMAAEMVLRYLGVGPGDEVILPAYTYTATASVVCHVGATPVMVDIEKDQPWLSLESVEKALTPKTKVVIPVDLGGTVPDYDALKNLLEEKKNLWQPGNDIQAAIGRVAICADTAHSLGASRRGCRVGSMADFSSFSFHAVKNVTSAEGGAITWKLPGQIPEEIYQKFSLMALHGQSKDALSKMKAGAWEYDVIAPYYKCNMTDIQAALGRVQLQRFPEAGKRRKAICQAYDLGLGALPVTVLQHEDPGTQMDSSCHLYLVRVKGIEVEKRNSIISEMAKRGISCNVHYKPLPLLSAYRDLGFHMEDYPNSYDYYRNVITLPLYSKLTDEEAETVMTNFGEVVKGCECK